MGEQVDISFKSHRFSGHPFIMARVSPSLLPGESLWKRLHHVDGAKACGFRGIIKQRDPSIGSQQAGVAFQEHINTKSRSESGATAEQNLR